MSEIIRKAHVTNQPNSNTCYNHQHPVIYPMEYNDCPACDSEKITRVTLGMD